MKYLGIDYGVKRVGLAVSDAMGGIAFPRTTFPNDAKLIEGIQKILADEKVEAIVVGDTRSFSGHANDVTQEAEEFMQRLAEATGLVVTRAWEAGSSIEASRYTEDGNGHDDASAAAIILQRYLDMKGTAIQ